MNEQKPEIPGYKVGDLIGQGASAHVWQVISGDGGVYAAKIFDEPGAERGAIEWEALRRYHGPHIIDALDWILCSDGRRALITEYASGGNLQDVVEGRGGLTSGECVTALAPIAGALSAIHDDGFVHGDLTPRNILFDSHGKPLLADLGASRPIAQAGAAEWGSTGFIAPEILDEETPNSAVDVYALGACAWFALVGEAPGPPVIRPHLRDVVPDVAPGLAEFINAALTVSPGARPNMEQAQAQLMGATQSVVVPLSTTKSSAASSTMTLRLRAEAARKQQPGRSAPVQGERRRAHQRDRTSLSSHRLGGALLSGLALAMIAYAVPLGGHVKPHPYLEASTVVHQARVTSAKKTATGNSSLTLTDIQQLLACRAELWQQPGKSDPSGCMAAGSPALAEEKNSVTQAKNANLRYEGLTFAVKGPVHMTAVDSSTEVVLTTIARSAYALQDGKGAVQVPARQEKVAITFTRQKGHWRMVSWKGA